MISERQVCDMRTYDSIITGDAAIQFSAELRRPNEEAICQRNEFISDMRVGCDEVGNIFMEIDSKIEEIILEIKQQEIVSEVKIQRENPYETLNIIVARTGDNSTNGIRINKMGIKNKKNYSYSAQKVRANMAKKQIYVNAKALPVAS